MTDVFKQAFDAITTEREKLADKAIELRTELGRIESRLTDLEAAEKALAPLSGTAAPLQQQKVQKTSRTTINKRTGKKSVLRPLVEQILRSRPSMWLSTNDLKRLIAVEHPEMVGMNLAANLHPSNFGEHPWLRKIQAPCNSKSGKQLTNFYSLDPEHGGTAAECPVPGGTAVNR